MSYIPLNDRVCHLNHWYIDVLIQGRMASIWVWQCVLCGDCEPTR